MPARPTPPAAPAWAEPAAEEVAPEVWRIPLPLPGDALRAVNVYALRDGAGLTLVDGGWAMAATTRALAAGLTRIGAQLGDIRRLLVTHVHRDHYTAAVTIRREFGSRVLLGAGERHAIEVLTAAERPGLARALASLERHGAMPVAAALRAAGGAPPEDGWEAPDDWIGTGDRFGVGTRTLVAIATPGHTRGHTVFVDREAGLLFAGDHVLPHITPSVGFEVDPSPLALGDFLRSLSVLRELPDLRLLPAHGPAGASVHARVDELLAHHATRLHDAARILDGGAHTAYQVAAGLTWTRHRRPFAELDPFNQMLAVFETAQHLQLLVAKGRAVVTEEDALRLFALPAPQNEMCPTSER